MFHQSLTQAFCSPCPPAPPGRRGAGEVCGQAADRGPVQATCMTLVLAAGREAAGPQEEAEPGKGDQPAPEACPLPQALCTKVPELIRTIMGWTLDFLRERLLGWIQDQGGWVRPQTPSLPPGTPPPAHLSGAPALRMFTSSDVVCKCISSRI